MNTIIKAVSVLLSVLMLPFYALTGAIDLISAGQRNEDMHTNIVGIGAYFRSQGITTDGEYLYFSSKTTLYKTDMSGKYYEGINLNAIPDELSGIGIKHIGGISYYNGFIYAGMEDSKVWDHPVVGVFDTQTLELVKYYELDCEVHTRGLPWVTVDENGILYAFDHSKTPEKCLGYDVNNEMESVSETALAETVKSVQGGEFYNGRLITATNDDTQAIYAVDVATGAVEKITDRNLTGGSEGEGMTIIQKDGKSYILAFDMGPLFINSNLRWYEI